MRGPSPGPRRSDGLVSAVSLTAVLSIALLAGGCSARSARIESPGGVACREAFYRGRYLPAVASGADDARDDRRSFRASVRYCVDGALLVELRGAVGGAQLVAGVRGEEVRLVIGRERLVVDGRDDAALWERWTGVPLTGRMLAAALAPGSVDGRTREVGGWSVRVEGGRPAGAFPAAAAAEGPRGERLSLELQSEREALRPGSAWPEVPPGFRLLSEPESRVRPGEAP